MTSRDSQDQAEAGLVEQVLAGDSAAMEQLLEPIERPLFAWIEFSLQRGARRSLEASDVFQESIYQVLSSLSRFDPTRGSFRQWAFGVAQKTLLKMGQAALRGGGSEGGRGESRFHPVAQKAWERTTRLSTLLSRDDSFRVVRETVLALPEEDQLLCTLMGLQGLTAVEVADQLGLGQEAVAKRWQRLRERLRRVPAIQSLLVD